MAIDERSRHPAIRALARPAPAESRSTRLGLGITVVVPTRDRAALVADTLRTLAALPYGDFRILVVDQSVDGATRAVVDAYRDDTRVGYHHSATTGSSAGRNAGAFLSGDEIVAYTDDDCIVTDGWLAALVDEFRDPRVSAVYGRLLPFEYEGRTGIDVGLKASLARAEFAAKTPPWYIGHGGNMAFRRADLLAVGGFDPLLGAGGTLRSNEDADVVYRLLAAGRRVVYSPRALVYHRQWKPWPDQQRMERAYGIGAGAQFGKYLRCGDPYGLRLLATWVWELGIRRLGAGLLKWRSPKVMYLGYCQMVYPWLGLWYGSRYRIDRRRMVYVGPGALPANTEPRP
jgi:glycosyltransferase involved in cell wall biosynthesis